MNKTQPNHQEACYRRTAVASDGVWHGTSPLSFSLPLLLAQVSLISAVAGATHFVLRRAGQQKGVSQIAAGAAIGISGGAALFPPQGRISLELLSAVGVMMFLFVVGVKTDVGEISSSGREAAALALSATLVPFAFTVFIDALVQRSAPPGDNMGELLFKLGAAWARTSYTVLSCVLDELNLLNSTLGRLAMSATLIAEFTSIVVSAVAAQIQILKAAAFLSFLGLLGFIFLVARPATLWIIKNTPEGEFIKEGYLLAVISMVVACGLISEVAGYHAATGTFILGLALPGGAPLGTTLERKLEAMVSGILVPLFMACAGFRVSVHPISGSPRCRNVVFFVLLGGVGKAVGVLLPCMYFNFPLRDAITLALMMNIKGIFEIHVINGWMDGQIADEEMYSVMVLCVVGFSAVTSFLVKVTYRPSLTYAAGMRRTIQHSRREAELRVLACVQNQDDVVPVLELLQNLHAAGESPLCVYVLHLVELAGQAAAMLTAYRKPLAPAAGAATATDHIMNAFCFFQDGNEGSVLVLPFVAASPPASMHNDVCALAMEKKVYFIVLPFHKKLAIDGTVKTHAAMRRTNLKTLKYAPCSVGILVGAGAGAGQVLRRVAVYFLGGADDREALAFSMRVADNPATTVMVVRFRLPGGMSEGSTEEEEEKDDEIVREFRMKAAQNSERVTYVDEVVQGASEMMGLIQSLSGFFSLLVVGRREGETSPLTEGLSTWIAHPELGALGGALASVNFPRAISMLVVQQQQEKKRHAELEPRNAGILSGSLGGHRFTGESSIPHPPRPCR